MSSPEYAIAEEISRVVGRILGFVIAIIIVSYILSRYLGGRAEPLIRMLLSENIYTDLAR